MSDTPQSQNPGLLANILAVAGFIILIIVIVWGAYHLLRLTGSGVSSLFSGFGGRADEISLTVPPEAQSGAPLTLSWEYTPSEDGTYALLYQCKNGFRFDMQSEAGHANAIPCGTAFTLGAGSDATLTPILADDVASLDVPVSILFMPAATSSDERAEGSATVHVIAAVAGAPEEEESPKPAPESPAAPAQPAGPANLVVRILAVGAINPVTGAFEARYPTGPADVAAVKFDIANVGGSASGSYYFTVSLPMQGGYTYTSPLQGSLTRGSHVESILRFKPVQPGGGTITVSADAANAVRESSEADNTAAMTISAPAWTGSYAPFVY